MIYSVYLPGITQNTILKTKITVQPGIFDYLFFWFSTTTPQAAGLAINTGSGGRIIPAVGSQEVYLHPTGIYGQEFNKINDPFPDTNLEIEINNALGSAMDALVFIGINTHNPEAAHEAQQKLLYEAVCQMRDHLKEFTKRRIGN